MWHSFMEVEFSHCFIVLDNRTIVLTMTFAIVCDRRKLVGIKPFESLRLVLHAQIFNSFWSFCFIIMYCILSKLFLGSCRQVRLGFGTSMCELGHFIYVRFAVLWSVIQTQPRRLIVSLLHCPRDTAAEYLNNLAQFAGLNRKEMDLHHINNNLIIVFCPKE